MTIAPHRARLTAALALALATLGLAACSDGAGADADAAPDAPAVTTHFLASELHLPANLADAMQLGLDLDLDRGLDDGPDNQFGQFLSALHNLAPGLDFRPFTADAVARGRILFLLELRTAGPGPSAGPAALASSTGRNPQPPACTGPTDQSCRRHLDGNATVSLDDGAGVGTALTGAVSGPGFDGDEGVVLLPIAIPDVDPIIVPLRRAKAELRGLTATGFGAGSKLGGAITISDLRTVVMPAIATSFRAAVNRDCPPPRTQPTCGCPDTSTGRAVLSFLDLDLDCALGESEVANLTNSFLIADIDVNQDGLNDAVSFGVGLEGVAASFPPLP